MAGAPGVGPKYPTPGGKNPKILTPAEKLAAKRASQVIKPGHAPPGKGFGNLKASYDAYNKSHPGAKPGSAFMDWFNKSTGGGAGGGPPAASWDPLAGMPGQNELTPFPTMDYNDIPDGSNVKDAPARNFKPGRAQLLNPNQYADQVGGKAYNPIIDALSQTKDRLSSGIDNANSMLDARYGASKQAALTGAQTVADSTAKANLGLTDLAARLAQVAGGDPTAAAAVGQSVANTQQDNKRFADVATQTQADQAAAADRDLASAKLGYKGATDTSIADLVSKIGSAKTEASQSRAKGIQDALGFNSQQQTAQQGRDVAAQEAWLAGQLAGPQITAGKLANEGTRATLVTNKHNTEVNDWTSLNQSKRTQYMDAVTKWTNKNVANQMKDALAQGKTPAAELGLADPQARAQIEQEIMGPMLTKAGPGVDPGKMWHQSLDTMKRAYPDSSPEAIKKLASIFVSKQLGIWNSQHNKGQQNSGKTWKMSPSGQPVLVKA